MSLWTALLGGCAASPPANLGLHDGHLASCPAAPHCVSSQARRDGQRVEPLRYSGSRKEARARLLAAIRALPRTHIETERPDYVHATQRSRVFGFVDDLECHLPKGEGRIDVRSASRIGYYDFGVNRDRIERLREEFRHRAP